MKFYDTHAHFEKCDNAVEIVGRAAQAGVSEILAIGGSDELNCNALGTGLRTAIGLDRDQAQGNIDLNALCELIAAGKPCVAAIGEIGLGGEIRGSAHAGERIRECRRMGFDTCIVPKSALTALRKEDCEGIRVIGASNLTQLFKAAEKCISDASVK